MNDKNKLEKIKNELLETLDETFERHHGIYIDKGTSLFETLAKFQPLKRRVL